MIRSVRRARDHVGRIPSVADYRAAFHALRAAGEELEEINRVIRHFGSWRRAKEALELSDESTSRRIEARFRLRRLDKIWKYTEETLRETLERCASHYGRPPTVAEFGWWRQRELELAHAEGNDAFHLPSARPYRRCWGTWESALRHLGYDPELCGTRLEQP